VFRVNLGHDVSKVTKDK